MMYIIFAILLLVAIFVIVLVVGKLMKIIPYFGAEKEVDIEKIIEKVKKEYPDYKVNKIMKYNDKILITGITEDNCIMIGFHLEYSKGRLRGKNTTMNDMLKSNDYEIIYDAYPIEFY